MVSRDSLFVHLVVRPVNLTAPSGQPGQPLVLTQAQLAQLQQSGILKMAGNSRPAAPATAAPVVTSASNAIGLGVAGKPIVIKTEPAMVMSPLQATGRPTVLQAVPAAAVSNASPDNDVSITEYTLLDTVLKS